MQTIIKNGLLVLTEGCQRADILLADGKIAEIGSDLQAANADIYDAEGCLVFPGFIDAHTHLDSKDEPCPTAADFSNGSKAALLGGTTTVLDCVSQISSHGLQKGLGIWFDLSAEKSYCDYGFHVTISTWNNKIAAELPKLVAKGITSFRVNMAAAAPRLSDAQIYEICRQLRLLSSLLLLHTENGDLVDVLQERLVKQGYSGPETHPLSRPGYLEAEAVSRAWAIAAAAETVPYITNLSSAHGLEVALAARARGQKVWLETCPQYLFLTEELYRQPGLAAAKYVCSPPLRSQADQSALWQAVIKGDIDTIASDHHNFNFKEDKELGQADFRKIPSGLPGVEQRVLLMYSRGVATGKISPERLAALAAETPARIFGLYPRKGILRVGSDADVVIIERSTPYPIQAATQAQNVDYTPYEGIELTARIRAVYLRGQQVVEDGKLNQEQPQGQFLQRGPSAGV